MVFKIKKVKSKILILIFTVIVLTVVNSIGFYRYDNKIILESFDLNDYTLLIKNHPYNANIGEINDMDKALENCEILLRSVYGDSLIDQYPYRRVEYDNTNETWFVSVKMFGRLHNLIPFYNTFSYSPFVIVKSNGDVLCVYN